MKYFKLFSLTVLFVVFLSSTVFSQVTNSLVGYWPLSGNANDESGNNNNGTVTNAILSTDRFGRPNEALYFNGADSKIQISNTEEINLHNQSFSVSMWFKSDTIRYWQTLISSAHSTYACHLIYHHSSIYFNS